MTTRYPYEIRRYALYRFDGALPGSPPIYLTAPGDQGRVLDHGTIDRATPDAREPIERALKQLAAAEDTRANFARFVVVWQRAPRGPHARLFRGLQRDAVPATN